MISPGLKESLFALVESCDLLSLFCSISTAHELFKRDEGYHWRLDI